MRRFAGSPCAFRLAGMVDRNQPQGAPCKAVPVAEDSGSDSRPPISLDEPLYFRRVALLRAGVDLEAELKRWNTSCPEGKTWRRVEVRRLPEGYTLVCAVLNRYSYLSPFASVCVVEPGATDTTTTSLLLVIREPHGATIVLSTGSVGHEFAKLVSGARRTPSPGDRTWPTLRAMSALAGKSG